MKKNIAIVLAFVAFAFIACDKNTPYEPGPKATTDQYVFFPVTANMGVELDPDAGVDSIDIAIARTKVAEAQDIKLVATVNTDKAFIVPESVHFNAGQAKTTITVKFDTIMQVGSTYAFTIQPDMSEINPYAAVTDEKSGEALYPTYSYEATVIKYIDAEGVFADDLAVTALFGVAPVAWHVDYQYAELPGGNIKVRVLSPYASLATEVDEYGLYDGFPYNAPADIISEQPYNFIFTVYPANKEATLEDADLGIDYGYGPMQFINYNKQAIGGFDANAGKIDFDYDLSTNTIVVAMGGSPYRYAGFRFYFSTEDYVADNAPEEEAAAPAKVVARDNKARTLQAASLAR